MRQLCEHTPTRTICNCPATTQMSSITDPPPSLYKFKVFSKSSHIMCVCYPIQQCPRPQGFCQYPHPEQTHASLKLHSVQSIQLIQELLLNTKQINRDFFRYNLHPSCPTSPHQVERCFAPLLSTGSDDLAVARILEEDTTPLAQLAILRAHGQLKCLW